MSDQKNDQNPIPAEWRSWLSTPMTITQPRWVFVAAAAVAVILLLVALD
jgi:hypothetical protein